MDKNLRQQVLVNIYIQKFIMSNFIDEIIQRDTSITFLLKYDRYIIYTDMIPFEYNNIPPHIKNYSILFRKIIYDNVLNTLTFVPKSDIDVDVDVVQLFVIH
jgi:hypothetical protein